MRFASLRRGSPRKGASALAEAGMSSMRWGRAKRDSAAETSARLFPVRIPRWPAFGPERAMVLACWFSAKPPGVRVCFDHLDDISA